MSEGDATGRTARDDQSDPVGRSHLTLSGTAVVSPAFVARLGRAAWMARLVYNAAIDARVPFRQGLLFRLRQGEARRACGVAPDAPIPSDRFLAIPREQDLRRELTSIFSEIPLLRAFPRSILDNAIGEACRARARHARDCAAAKAEGRRLPTLHFRSASDDWSVSTDAFMLLRIGDDVAQRKPKTRNVTAKTLSNRRIRAIKRAARERDWADEKRRCGWNEDKILVGLTRRSARQDRDRAAGAARDATLDPRERQVRRDSPKATLGARRLKIDVVGLRRARIDLGRDIPPGAEAVRLTLVKPAWRGAKVEVRLTVTVPSIDRSRDEDAVRDRLHAFAAALPPATTPMAAVLAARAAGLAVRGEDLGVAHPSCDDTGRATAPVRMPRADLRRMRAAQQALSHRERLRREAEKGRGAPKGQPSKKAQRDVARIRAILRTAADRSKTRACQDAAALVKDVVLVATDPASMVGGLYRKGGPAERRARPASEPRPRGWIMGPSQQRALRRNLHATRFAFRIRRTATLCERAGIVHATPDHRGSTSTCPSCLVVAPKTLAQRRHDCPCGLSMPRDQASAIMTLGRALLSFRDGPDPGGILVDRREAERKIREKANAWRKRLAEGARKARDARASATAEVSLRPRDVVIPGPAAKPRKRLRGQGRNVRSVPKGISN